VLDAVSTDAFQRAVLGGTADVRALLHRPGVARATFGSLSAVARAEDSRGPEMNGGVAVTTDSEVLERALSIVEKQAGQMLSAVEARRAVLTDLLNAEEEEEWRGARTKTHQTALEPEMAPIAMIIRRKADGFPSTLSPM